MFKQLSSRVSAKTIEETYTENDVEHVIDETGKQTTDISAGYDPTTGFTFDYPMRWLNDASDFKAIGIRRLKVIPTSHVFTLSVHVQWKPPSGSDGNKYYKVPMSIQQTNTLEEIIHDFINTLNSYIDKASALAMGFGYDFDYKTGELTLKADKGTATSMQFSIFGSGGTTEIENNYLDFFLKFLNQERNDTNRNILKNLSTTKTFHNVWDRSSLQFHASFSDNRRGFIGLNNDFYENPSIFYDPPTNSSNFWIRFTTDGTHQILPRYCKFYIGLCYVRNYKNSLVTK